MTAVLRGRISRLVQRQTPAGIVFEFWVDAVEGSGPARASDRIAGQFREGDLVQVEGKRDANGVLDANSMTRIAAAESPLPPWLRSPARRLLLLVPLAALLAMAVMDQIGDVIDADGALLPVLWAGLGIALFSYGRKKIQRQPWMLLAKTVSAAMVVTAAATLLQFGALIETVEKLLVVAAVLAGITVAALVVYERRSKPGTPAGAGTAA
jgi:hypothetical protein